MSPEEHQLITGLFDRMNGMGRIDKDRDAENLINQSVRQMPDSAYMLVQSVLVQEQALQQAGARIEELEEQVRQMEAQGSRAPAQSGGFLGGLFGGGQPARPQPSAVPSHGRSATPQGYGQQRQAAPMAARGGTPWGGQGQQPMGQAAAGGGFMKTAMATAAGVAGGMLLANSISGMMSGSSAGGAQTASNDSAAADTAAPQEASYADPNDNDPGTQDASYDSGGDWGGGDDMDI